MIATLTFLPLWGFLADKVPSRIIIPMAFGLRCFAGFMFLQIKDPRSAMSVAFCVLYVVSSTLENISVESLYFKAIPSDIRGVMLGLFWFCAFVGNLAFTAIGGHLFDKIGPTAPFAFLLIVDCIYFTVVVLLGICGKLKE